MMERSPVKLARKRKRKRIRTWRDLCQLHTSMLSRCYNPKSTDYPRYGAKGITVCDRWRGAGGIANLRSDMGERPSPRHTLDRIDGSKGYSKENCRWATWHQQNSNRLNNNRVVGVSYNKKMNRWHASLYVQGKFVLRKNFLTFEEAVQARKEAERALLGFNV